MEFVTLCYEKMTFLFPDQMIMGIPIALLRSKDQRPALHSGWIFQVIELAKKECLVVNITSSENQ
jgi:hypothetical protein